MDNKYSLIVSLIVSFVVGGVVGFVVGGYYSGDGVLTNGERIAELEAKIEKAKKLFPSISDIRSVSGTIEEINGNSIVIKSFQGISPFEDLPEKFEILVTNATKIIRMIQKDPQAFQKEIEAIQKGQSGGNVSEISSSASFPNPFIEKEITAKDLKVGGQVSVEAGENIKGKTRFDATRVIIQESFN
ncbi:MAG: hypothetical protein AAB362_02765 [Patescibacteria group bacterium]